MIDYGLRLSSPRSFIIVDHGAGQVALKRQPNREVSGFKYLLRCVYNRPFELDHCSEIDLLAEMADFYGAGSTI